MTDKTMKLYQSAGSPIRGACVFSSLRKAVDPLVPVDLGKGEQHSRPIGRSTASSGSHLVLEDGTAIGEVPAIVRYIEEIHPQTPLLVRPQRSGHW